jgi:hypothetical protein
MNDIFCEASAQSAPSGPESSVAFRIRRFHLRLLTVSPFGGTARTVPFGGIFSRRRHYSWSRGTDRFQHRGIGANRPAKRDLLAVPMGPTVSPFAGFARIVPLAGICAWSRRDQP